MNFKMDYGVSKSVDAVREQEPRARCSLAEA